MPQNNAHLHTPGDTLQPEAQTPALRRFDPRFAAAESPLSSSAPQLNHAPQVRDLVMALAAMRARNQARQR
jgi:hypothetical protein